MADPRGIFAALRGQLERLFDAVEDRQGRIDGVLVGLRTRLRELRAEREPLEQRCVHLAREVELGRLREQHHRERARQALPDETRALESLRKARLAGRETDRIDAQRTALLRLKAALDAELDALERRVVELDALRGQLRVRQAVEVARRLEAVAQLSVSASADTDPDSDLERELRAELAQLMEKP